MASRSSSKERRISKWSSSSRAASTRPREPGSGWREGVTGNGPYRHEERLRLVVAAGSGAPEARSLGCHIIFFRGRRRSNRKHLARWQAANLMSGGLQGGLSLSFGGRGSACDYAGADGVSSR